MRQLALASLCSVFLAACGGGGDGDPDARPPGDARVFDAAPKVYCANDTDTACGYTPAAVTPAEISLADQLALAQRFNPAQVMTAPDVWAVSVSYNLQNGTGLMRAEHDGRLNFTYDVDENTYEAVPGAPADPSTLNLHTLPLMAPNNKPYAYFVDHAGTNTGNAASEETWSTEWRTIQGYADPGEGNPTAAPYPPVQYAHPFWLSKDDSLLAISYWFYYPYDKFTNNHEGDWEHINVVLDYEDPEDPFIAFAQFSEHGRQHGVRASDLYRVSSPSGGDHTVVFTGGESCVMFNLLWCGDASGASWPYPGVWKIGYDEVVAGTTGRPGRAIHATDFTVVLLPRIEDVDFDANPSLSWYGMPFLAGEPTTAVNDLTVMSTNNHRAPVGPSPDHEEFEAGIEQTFDIFLDGLPAPFVAPSGWTLISEPPASVFP